VCVVIVVVYQGTFFCTWYSSHPSKPDPSCYRRTNKKPVDNCHRPHYFK